MTKKVAHLTTMHARDEVRILLKECTSLSAAGYDVHLIAADGHGSDTVNNVKRYGVDSAHGRFHRMFIKPWQIWRVARRFRAQIYHLHEPELLLIAPLLKWTGAHVIYDSHEDVARAILGRDWIHPSLRRVVSLAFEIFENFIVRQISAVIAATPHIALRFCNINPRITTINNFPLLSEIGEPVERCGDLRTVCYIGSIGKSRGLFEMIRAVERATARLILAGPFESDVTEFEAKQLPGWSCVEYRGIVSRAEVLRIMSQSRAGLVLFHPLPNHIEAQPNKLFEYMSAGLPIIASDFPLWRRIIDGVGCGLLVDPLNPAEIADTMCWILGHPAEGEVMGQLGQQAVAQIYNWDVESIKLIDLYNELLAQ